MDAHQLDPSSLNAVKATLDLYLARYNATDKLWAYFATVTLAVIGFSVGSDKSRSLSSKPPSWPSATWFFLSATSRR